MRHKDSLLTQIQICLGLGRKNKIIPGLALSIYSVCCVCYGHLSVWLFD